MVNWRNRCTRRQDCFSSNSFLRPARIPRQRDRLSIMHGSFWGRLRNHVKMMLQVQVCRLMRAAEAMVRAVSTTSMHTAQCPRSCGHAHQRGDFGIPRMKVHIGRREAQIDCRFPVFLPLPLMTRIRASGLSRPVMVMISSRLPMGSGIRAMRVNRIDLSTVMIHLRHCLFICWSLPRSSVR